MRSYECLPWGLQASVKAKWVRRFEFFLAQAQKQQQQ